MKFKLEHHFACTPEQYWAIVRNDEVDHEMARASNGEYELLSEQVDGDVLTRRQQIVMKRDLPKPMLKVLGTDRIGYVLETRVNHADSRSDWTITPLVLADRVTGAGVAVVTATTGGCRRVIEGDLTVRVPLLGRKMEERLVSDVSESYDRGAEIIARRVAALGES